MFSFHKILQNITDYLFLKTAYQYVLNLKSQNYILRAIQKQLSKGVLSKKCLKIFRKIHGKTPVSESFLTKLQVYGKIPVPERFFNKVAGWRPATLLKRRFPHRCFLVNFGKFLRVPILQKTYGPLLLAIGKMIKKSQPFQLHIFLSIYDLLVDTRHQRIKTE